LEAETDPIVSPIKASDELLLQLPKVKIITGDKDPLHDDVWRFANRLLKLNK